MKVIKGLHEMMSLSDMERAKGKIIRFVPTMGALHKGHCSLIEIAAKSAYRDEPRPAGQTGASSEPGRSNIVVIVSIFVNHLQFNNPEDFAKYPIKLQEDFDVCATLDVDYLFVPDQSEMYSSSDLCTVNPIDRMANILEGKSRPGHFKGMLTVVCKLFNITKPHEAFFGEKDYQQLLLVTRMSRDLSMGIRIVPVATVRDDDMLPLSSRNVRMTDQQRQIAPVMYKILADAKQAMENRQMLSYNTPINSILASSITTALSSIRPGSLAELIKVDYLELRCSRDLTELEFNHVTRCFDCTERCMMQEATGEKNGTFKARLLISVVVGDVRLLDNIEVILNK